MTPIIALTRDKFLEDKPFANLAAMQLHLPCR